MKEAQKKGKHRAVRAMDAVKNAYPKAWISFERLRKKRGTLGFRRWPDWCYVPIAAADWLVSRGHQNVPSERLSHPAILTAIGAWRMTKSLYRFNQTLMFDLFKTPIDRDLPLSHLLHLPEWCLYISLMDAGLKLDQRVVYGAWVHLNDAFAIGRPGQAEFCMVIDCAKDPKQPFADNGLLCVPPLKIDGGSFADYFVGLPDVEPQQSKKNKKGTDPNRPQDMRGVLSCVLSLALYICADPEFTRRGRPGRPSNPLPKVKNDVSFEPLPAKFPLVWDVGQSVAEALRRVYESKGAEPPGAPTKSEPKSEHTGGRCGHWYTFTSGPGARREAEASIHAVRTHQLRWISPTPTENVVGLLV